MNISSKDIVTRFEINNPFKTLYNQHKLFRIYANKSVYEKSLTTREKTNGHQPDTVIGQCIVALDFVNSALSDKQPLRFLLLSFCGLSRAVRLRVPNARSLHRRRVANRGTASDRRVIHLPRKVITP